MEKYNLNDLQDLYRRYVKYRETNDIDYLPGAFSSAKNISKKSWVNICSMVDLAVINQLSVEKVAEALRALGFVRESESEL